MVFWMTLCFVLGIAFTGAGLGGMYMYGAALWNTDHLGATAMFLTIGAVGFPFLAAACTLLIAGSVFFCTAVILDGIRRALPAQNTPTAP